MYIRCASCKVLLRFDLFIFDNYFFIFFLTSAMIFLGYWNMTSFVNNVLLSKHKCY